LYILIFTFFIYEQKTMRIQAGFFQSNSFYSFIFPVETWPIDWDHLFRLCLKTETKSSPRNAGLITKQDNRGCSKTQQL
jgi:hypothetical protein